MKEVHGVITEKNVFINFEKISTYKEKQQHH